MGRFHVGSTWRPGLVALLVGVLPATLSAQPQPTRPESLPVPKAAPAPGASAGDSSATPPAGRAAPAGPTAPGPRDPFDPLVKKPSPGEERRLQEISSLRLVGVIWDARDPDAIRALVQTADGLGYYLRVNDEKFGGKVIAVRKDLIQFSVREDVPGARSRERTIELRLAKPEGQQ